MGNSHDVTGLQTGAVICR